MKHKILISLLALAIVVCSIGGTFAAFKSETRSTNKISLASVRGQIVEKYDEGQTVMIGNTVDKVVNVKNTGNTDMIVRVSIEKRWKDKDSLTSLSSNNIFIEYDLKHWYYDNNDSYYYYKDVLKPGETTQKPLFSEFKLLSGNDDANYGGKTGEIQINMECIQAGGDGISVWGQTFEKLGISYENNKISTQTEVVFENPKDGFVFNAKDGNLFANFKNLVPGETISQNINIKNNFQDNLEIFLRADYSTQSATSEKEKNLINQLLRDFTSIKILNESGQILYNGPVYGNLENGNFPDSMKQNISLGKFNKNENKGLYVQLTLDPLMDNEYRELIGKVDWIFSAADTETIISDGENPNTGAEMEVAIWFVLIGFFSIALCVCVLLGRKRKNKN
ncbi:MAG: BsaA family SipW-dependent biofilm matrix protein [Clostridia bacterium]